MKTRTTAIKQKVIIPATPQEVYEAFTDPKIYSAFTGSKYKGVAKVGEKFTVYDISGKYLELEKGRRIVVEWVNSTWPEGFAPSTVELTFKAASGGTELTFVQSNAPLEMKEYLPEGWTEYFWNPLKEYFGKKSKKE